jgi:CheY-like chemotaxis protein
VFISYRRHASYGGTLIQDTAQKTVAWATHTILLVDDDVIVIRAMQNILRRSGFATIGCLTGTDALSKCAAGIDAAVVDIHLPDINGLALSQQLRKALGPAAPIIILSGDTSMDTIRALPDAGATYFCSKPVNTSILIKQLKEWLGIVAL